MSQMQQVLQDDLKGVATGAGEAVSAPGLEEAGSTAKATPAAKSDAQKWREYVARQKGYSKKYQDRKAQERKQHGVHRYAVLFPESAFAEGEGRNKKKVAKNVRLGGWVSRFTQDENGKMQQTVFIYGQSGKLLVTVPMSRLITEPVPFDMQIPLS